MIDEEKCIRCGQCAAKCPFGAIGTKTWITNVIADLKAGKKVYAILAQQQKDSLVKILQWKAGDRQ